MDWTRRTVLVTGAGGFIGSHLTERLASEGAHVRAFVRYNSRGDIKLLSLLPPETLDRLDLIEGLDDTFLVINGDVLTSLDLGSLLAWHRAQGAVATIATHRREAPINDGIIESEGEDNRITAYIEKPVYRYQVSVGVYILEPAVLGHMPPGAAMDVADLMRDLVTAGHGCWPTHSTATGWTLAVTTTMSRRQRSSH